MWAPEHTIAGYTITNKPTASHYPGQFCPPNQFISNWVLFYACYTTSFRLFMLQIAKLSNSVDVCLHGVGVDQRLVVDGPGSLCCQLGGEVAVGSRKTLIVVL